MRSACCLGDGVLTLLATVIALWVASDSSCRHKQWEWDRGVAALPTEIQTDPKAWLNNEKVNVRKRKHKQSLFVYLFWPTDLDALGSADAQIQSFFSSLEDTREKQEQCFDKS